MDAITLLKDDHRSLERLFKRYEQAGDRAFVEKRALVDRIIEELSRHAAIEEQLFYPVARATVPGTDDIALESLEEHHIVKWVLSELERMDPTDERFDAKVTVLIENVRHHVEEEESEFFPKVRDELGRNALGDLGDTMAKFKEVAPTHPHPTSPDTPPGNLVTGAAAGVVDHVTDTISGVAQGTVTALQDLIALVLRRKRPSTSPTGSTVARKQAKKVRNEVADLTDSAIDAAKAAQSSAERTVKAAKTGAERTVKTAKTGAKRTATTARNSADRTTTTARKGAKATRSAAKATATSTARTATTAAKRTSSTARTGAKRTASAAKRG
ncbi:MAG TPA: hemerythrin domain-containing protein [Microthrixaceae bacterium]|jgi:cell division septum initiation protein DivIVA/hemerythrin-like domain-containing protein|nr:hemerythrin domain-containing protein [Microthrixaceae bacterium]